VSALLSTILLFGQQETSNNAAVGQTTACSSNVPVTDHAENMDKEARLQIRAPGLANKECDQPHHTPSEASEDASLHASQTPEHVNAQTSGVLQILEQEYVATEANSM
jgi:hypothetical protein